MSIFPFINPQGTESIGRELPMAREWAWDYEKNQFKLENRKMYKVEGNEAIKIWIWKLLKTPRYRYLIYSWDYGQELENLIGQNYTHELMESEIKRYIREGILATLEGYVLEVKEFDIEFNLDKLTVAFSIVTPYGEVEMYV